MRNRIIIIFTLVGSLFYSCGTNHDPQQLDQFSKNQLNEWHDKLTEVIISDIFTPPVASRIYVYPHIAAYEVLRNQHPEYKTLAGQLNEFSEVPAPEAGKEIYYPLASIVAFSTAAQYLVFNVDMLTEYETQYLQAIQEVGISKKIFENSVAYGRKVGNHLIEYAKNDGYIARQSLPRYILEEEPGKWVPTPPDYMPGIEPHWATMRTLVLDSSTHFVPPPPTPFDTVPGSKFYQECMEVYETVNNLNEEQMEIAKFWDCNPNISFTKGHVMFYHQQISPGGHWLSIASIVSRMEDMDFMRKSEAFTLTSIALYDAFISCWDEKYRSSLIRPETYIDRYIDPDWKPILQTPAFPEYTSGHSVISAAASVALTKLLGDNYAFADSSEVEYGLPVRHYESFYHASNEAAISRLYGGIHYRPACDNGVSQGRKVGNYIMDKIKTRENMQAMN